MLVSVLFAAFFGLAAADDESGLLKWLQLRADLRASQERIAAIETEIAKLRKDVADLEADPFAIERAIREDLEFARQGETVVRFVRPGAHAVSRLRQVE